MIEQEMEGFVDLLFAPYLGAEPYGEAQHHWQGVISGQKNYDEHENDQVA